MRLLVFQDRFATRIRILILLISLVSFHSAAFGSEKKILLRNETIVTRPILQRQAALPPEAPSRDLFLLQLADDLPGNWREQLDALGVSLLRPVPHDAFVAQFPSISPSEIRALPFVHWLGRYEPRHKIHQALLNQAPNTQAQPAAIQALLAPGAAAGEVAIVQRQFSSLRRYSKHSFGRVLEGELPPALLRGLTESSAVLWVEPAPQMKLVDAVAAQIVGGEGEDFSPAVHDLGFTGEGVIVAVADSGLNNGDAESMHPDLAGRIEAFFHYGTLEDAADEHSHGTHVAGIIAGDGAAGETDAEGFLYGLGIAPKARLVAQRIFDGVGAYEAPPSFAKLTTDAVRAGAVIGSNSWGDDTQGRYDISAMEFDALVRDADPETAGDQPYILEFSAGNAGPGARTIGTPAVAKNVIATGASQNNRAEFLLYSDGEDFMADFSSRGPCEDGRIKPDLVAPGTWIASLKSFSASDENAWDTISGLYMYQGGTSQSGPQVSGAAAVFVEYYRSLHNGQTPSPALVKAGLINSAVDMDNEVEIGLGGTGYVPNNHEGWGRVDLTEMIGAYRTFDFTDQTTSLATGQSFEKRFYVASYQEPLKITLAYTDVPGFPPAIPALVNDLDLEVTAPDGRVFRGNHFIRGESVAIDAAPDSINNIEAVHIRAPDPGEYIVRVIARRVIEDARRDTPADDQDFALVLSGSVPAPGEGIVALNRRAYNASATVEIKLIDFDLTGEPVASVQIKSTSQPTPLLVELQKTAIAGVFTGAVQTASLPVANDGRLHIAHGDIIEVTYNDASPARMVRRTARADLLPPVITQVSSTNRFGREIVSWSTDELANSAVYYRSNSTYSAVSSARFTDRHELIIENLVPDQVYQYYVVSADEAGNRSTNNNAGQLFSFTARTAATVLLVDTYQFQNTEFPENTEIPVTSYTDALDRTGVSYEVWDTEVEGSPDLSDLKPYRVVIWRLNDSFYENQNITHADQNLITEYIGQGGSFLLSSMDILTRIMMSGHQDFLTNVLQMASYTYRAHPLEECPECNEDYGVPSIHGATLESLTTGIDLELDYSAFPYWDFGVEIPIGPDLSDVFVPSTNAVPIFYDPEGQVCGIRYPRTGQDAQGRVVFLSFPLDAIPLDGPAPNNRANLLRNMLSFLAPGVNGLGSIALDSTSYSAPALATIEVADSDLIGQSSITVRCRNGAAQTTVELRPTVTPGLFRGSLTLVTNTAPLSPGQMSVADGDLVTAEYMDRSAGSLVRASAEIDLGLPEISNIEVLPDFENAIISWETDEPADALVQFGESRFLGKTAYVAGNSLYHEVLLPALTPNRLYYYQVVSRDSAGNAVIDNNNGRFYTFRTLQPVSAPWSDNMESGAPDWSVHDGELTEASWVLGTPNNIIADSAHSGERAWGVNMDGFSAGSYVQTFLISPAVSLQGGPTAKLKFWHNYDFLGDSILEMGHIQLFTNTQTQPIILGQYSDFTVGWEQQEFDLTPYLGRVVQIVWVYELLHVADNFEQFPGWFIDDVEITVGSSTHGRLQVTNNLAAAAFNISGPLQTSGNGRWFSSAEAPPGEYTIQWQPVPYYETPSPQTETLALGATLRFLGNYTMTDENQNSMPDPWELEQFGELSETRTRSTDSDADNFPDLAEFIAGTDPLDPASRLALGSVQILPAGSLEFSWPAVPGKTYQLLSSPDAQTWTLSATLQASSAAAVLNLDAPVENLFYKLEVIP